MRKRWIIGMAVVSVPVVAVLLFAAQSKDIISYQGRLTEPSGLPVDGQVSITFSIYDGDTAVTPLWTETQTVNVNGGIYHVKLGEVTSIPDDLFNGAERYLGIKVESDPEMTPRTKITSVGYSFNAKRIQGKKIRTGTANLNVSSSATGTANITFPEAFSTVPKIVTSGLSGQIGSKTFIVQSITNITNTGFDTTYGSLSGDTATGTASFDWTAAGE